MLDRKGDEKQHHSRKRSDSEPMSISLVAKISPERRTSRRRIDQKSLVDDESYDDDIALSSKPISLKEYVLSRGGKRVISKILIANNGIAALKAIRSIKKWCYDTFGNDKAIQFVAMATPEDIKANAAYIHLADEFVEVPGGPNNNNYANIMLIVETAERTGANAVWAGWGHASENPKLPEALAKSPHGIIWIGPPADAMRALGDKIGSTLIAQSAGVSCMPWSGDGLRVDYKKTGIPKDIYQKSCVKTAGEAKAVAERIGYPIMIKASEGGGGKGIRKVEKPEQLNMAFSQVQGEVPGSPVFIMKLSPVCRHLEVQLLADEHGQAISILGRDCSIQRRHQKIIEEGPVVAAPPEVWREMEKSAVRLAKEVGYTCAGTVEYLFTESNEYYFLELNPRLQVEHPVTELISGVNLPAAQLQVAMGIPLHQLTGIRRLYGKRESGSSQIDFDNQIPVALPGHVIACRVTAENPEKEFQPTSGVIVELNFRSTPAVWGYFSVAAHGTVHEYSDSQFGHMFALGETREIARRNMVLALKELSIRGDIRTTVEYLRQILETTDFKRNLVNTTWLEKAVAGKKVQAEKPDPVVAVLLGAVFRAMKLSQQSEKEFLGALQRGQFPSEELYSSLAKVKVELIYDNIKYVFELYKSGPNSFDVCLRDWMTSVEVIPLVDDGMLVLMNGKKFVVYGQDSPAGLRLTIDSQTVIFGSEYDPTQLRSSMAGKLVRYVVENGTHVVKDQPYAEVEVMKMYITLMAPEAGVIEVTKTEGAILEAGDLLARLNLDHPERVKKADVFSGTFPRFSPPHPQATKANLRLKDNLKPLQMLLSGYKLGPGVMAKSLAAVMSAVRDPSLPLTQFNGIMSTLTGRIPEDLYDDLLEIARRYAEDLTRHRFKWETPESFPAAAITHAIDNHLLKLDKADANALSTKLSSITSLLKNYIDGNHNYAVSVLTSLLNDYYEVESYFNEPGQLPEFAIRFLRLEHKKPVDMVARIARAQWQQNERSQLVVAVLTIIGSELVPVISEFKNILKKLSLLSKSAHAGLVLKARQLLIRNELPASRERRIEIKTILVSAAESGSRDERIARLGPLIAQSQPLEDIIFTFFDSKFKEVAMEAYIRRTYQEIVRLEVTDDRKSGILIGKWYFRRKSPFEESKGGLHRVDSELHLLNSRSSLPSSSSPQLGSVTSPKLKKNPKKKKGKSKADPLEPTTTPSSPPLLVTPPPLAPLVTTLLSPRVLRQGIMSYFKDFDSMRHAFPTVLTALDSASPGAGPQEPVHVVYLGFPWRTVSMPTDDVLSGYLHTLVKTHEQLLSTKGVRRVTFYTFRHQKEEYPRFFTFRGRSSYDEDRVVRHIEPSNAIHMQLGRLSNFHFEYVPSSNRAVHVFAARPLKPIPVRRKEDYDGRRFFVRTIVRKLDTHALYASESGDVDLSTVPETEYAFLEALNSLEMAIGGERAKWRFNCILMNILTEARIDIKSIEAVLRLLAKRYRDKTIRLNVTEVEFCLNLRQKDEVKTYHFMCTNPTGFVLNIDCYQQTRDSSGRQLLEYVGQRTPKEALPYHGKEIPTPYPVFGPFDRKRGIADELGTIYVYDFLIILERAIQKIWTRKNRNPQSGESKQTNEKEEKEEREQRQRQSELLATLDLGERGESGSGDLATSPPMKHSRRLLVSSFSFGNLQSAYEAEEEEEEKESTPHSSPPSKALPIPDLKQESEPPFPAIVLKWRELILDPDCKDFVFGEGELKEVTRPPGMNDIGMVAWVMTLYLPEYPQGREIVVIANDITHQSGTFGIREDHLFDLASKYARKRGLPRIYIAPNSGARIGLAEELLAKFQIGWVGDDPFRGFSYLYLKAEDYENLKQSVIANKQVQPNGEVRFVITDIIGIKDGIGVENLRGSGQIAGETSHAYEEIFTLTYVTGRTVGIGAYLARLGQRCIQKQTAPIILTGFNALNKLLGRHVYSSNVQLGGPEIMYPNGVAHLTVEDDFHGIMACLDWLSYVPARRGLDSPAHLSSLHDSIDRPVQFKPTKQPYDPRHMLAGVAERGKEWINGFFDKDSFMEVLGGWAMTAIAGRARLGGMPIGVVAVETRQIEAVSPADPANPESKEQVAARAGQVWYPDSAFKTAQAIKDMVAEDLPIIIFANWRGFSGGMRDMFDEVLKYGSYIVDSLRMVKQPIEIYIPPCGNLRGGAWVVVDPTINEKYIEMFAAPDSRGGVLEPEGTVDVKFRAPEQLAAAHANDHILIALDKELAVLKKKKEDAEKAAMTPEAPVESKKPQEEEFEEDEEVKAREKAKETKEVKEAARIQARIEQLQKEIKEREKRLLPIYHQVASSFCDLHDTPGRMLAKGVIREVVPWEYSRRFFYWRIKRRKAELRLIEQIEEILSKSDMKVDSNPKDRPLWKIAQDYLYQWVKDIAGDLHTSLLKDDHLAVEWVQQNRDKLQERISQLHQQGFSSQIRKLAQSHPQGFLAGLDAVLQSLTPEQRKSLNV